MKQLTSTCASVGITASSFSHRKLPVEVSSTTYFVRLSVKKFSKIMASIVSKTDCMVPVRGCTAEAYMSDGIVYGNRNLLTYSMEQSPS
jgi:hypothetical protein